MYRKTLDGILRQELPGCFMQWRDEESFDRLGRKKERKFLLVQPGQTQRVFPGDRVFAGIGPEITQEDWAQFTPLRVERMGQVSYVTPYWWNGQLLHTEAGRK